MPEVGRNLCMSAKGLTKVFGFGRRKTVAVDHVDLNLYEGKSSRLWGNRAAEKLL